MSDVPHFAAVATALVGSGACGACRGWPVIARTRSQVRPSGFNVRGDLATRAGMGIKTEWLLT